MSAYHDSHLEQIQRDQTISTTLYTADALAMWEEFLKKSKNGTLFHSQRFLAYHSPGKFKDNSLIFLKENRPLALFPAVDWTDSSSGKRVLRSHPGSSYGGFVLPFGNGVEDAFLLVHALKIYARTQGFDAIEMRLAESVFELKPSEEMEFALLKNGFLYKSVELSTAIPTAQLRGMDEPGESAAKLFSDSARRSMNKAVKSGLVVREASTDNEFERFWDILAENLKKHDATPTHTLPEILNLRGIFPLRIKLFYGEIDSVMAAGMVLFVCNKAGAHTMYFGSDRQFQHVRPLNLVVLKCLEWVARNNHNYLNLGISTEHGGDVINWGLFRFKESFNGGGALRKSFIADLRE